MLMMLNEDEMRSTLREVVVRHDDDVVNDILAILKRVELDSFDLTVVNNTAPWWGQSPVFLTCLHGDRHPPPGPDEPLSLAQRTIDELLCYHHKWLEMPNSAGQTPLWVASREGHTHIVEHLVKTHNANVNRRSLDDRAPLWEAAWKGQLETVKFLCFHGAEPEAKCTSGNHGTTALQAAKAAQHADVIEFLSDVVLVTRRALAKKRLEGAVGAVRATVRLQRHIDELMYTPEEMQQALDALAVERTIDAERKLQAMLTEHEKEWDEEASDQGQAEAGAKAAAGADEAGGDGQEAAT